MPAVKPITESYNEQFTHTANQYQQELVAANEVLERQSSELRRSNDDLEQFARVVSHDLKAPLHTMLQFVEILRERGSFQPDAEVNSDLIAIAQAVERMRILIDDLLCYALVSGRGMQPKTPVAAQDALHICLDNLQGSISETRAVVTYDDLPIVEILPSQLVQLFQNLVGNAIHYRGIAFPSIHISCERAGDHWKFAVRDNGIGIKQEHQQGIFSPFKRLHGSERPGSGIGLAVCRKIVEYHDGQIWVESEPSLGSTFYFTLRA